LLDRDVTTAGRHPDSDIFLDDVTVSRRHAEFRKKDGGYSVTDVGSLNGTYVNREPTDSISLSNGDEVQIGKFRLVFFDWSASGCLIMSWSAVPSSDSTLSIGAVVDLLSSEFDDVSLSKLRFLESAGLISPDRTASGYRRYTKADIERLRYILTAQRDYFFPNKVIGEQLQRVDAGELTLEELAEQNATPVAAADIKEDFTHFSIVRLTERSLCKEAEIDPEFLDALIDADILRPTGAGFYVEDDVTIAQACKELHNAGIDTRHLKTFKSAIVKIADLVKRVSGASNSRPQSAEHKKETVEEARTLANSVSDLAQDY